MIGTLLFDFTFLSADQLALKCVQMWYLYATCLRNMLLHVAILQTSVKGVSNRFLVCLTAIPLFPCFMLKTKVKYQGDSLQLVS